VHADALGAPTGRLPMRTGNCSVPRPGRAITGSARGSTRSSSCVSDAGYATAAFGKWHVGDIEGRLPTVQGFDESPTGGGCAVTRFSPDRPSVVTRRGCRVAAVHRARIAAIPLFAELSATEQDAVAAVAGEFSVDAGTTLTKEGAFGHGFFAVEEGSADVVHDGVVVATLGPGEVFGEIAILASGRRTASVVASTSMRLITLFKRDLWLLEERAPQVAAALRETARERLARTSAERTPSGG
jgi:CRP/FNR family transcriptional regulator, cyclic AMP receptor protein